jgi:hypothetical protein
MQIQRRDRADSRVLPTLFICEEILTALEEGDDVAPPEPTADHESEIPRPIVSVNGKDVEKPDEPKDEKKPAA